MDRFAGKTVVITGGATGIGFGFAKAFGRDGATILLAEPREARLQEAVAALAALGIPAHYSICDVSQPEAVERLADWAWETTGQVDVLLNNAGITSPRKRITDAPLEAARQVFDVNVFGVWHGCASFGKRMITQGTPAAIYNLGSENSFFNAVPGAAAYIASKHAVHGLTVSLREEMPDFITVGLICPGWVRSELTQGAPAELPMDTDRFIDIVMPQIRAGRFYVVSHAHNMVHIAARHDAIAEAYATYAPRYAGDDEFDVRTLIARLSG